MTLRRTVGFLSAGEPEWLRAFRLENLQQYGQLPWERGKYGRLEVGDGTLSSISIDGFRISTPDRKTEMLDIFTALEMHPGLKSYFIAGGSKSLALQNAFMSGGFFIRVAPRARAIIPLDLVFAGNACARSIIVAEEGSDVSLVQRIAGEADFAALQADIHVKEGARVQLATVQDLSSRTKALMSQRAMLDRNARLQWTTGTLGCGMIRSSRDILLQGNGADASDLEVVFGAGEQQFELFTTIVHSVPATTGHSMTKGVLGGSARALTQGLARIEKSAPGSDSYLAEHVLLVSPQAGAEPMPFMEIDTNDVKAKHSGFVSRIDEEKLFYLKARGIGEQEARKMVVVGFLQTSMDQASLIRQDLAGRIERKWSQV